MIRSHRDVLRVRRVDLVKNLQCFAEMLDHLESVKVIFENQRHLILSEKTIFDTARAFLDTLQRCGPEAYPEFKNALSLTNQHSILESLRNCEEKLLCESPVPQDSTVLLSSSMSPPGTSVVNSPDINPRHALQPYQVTSSPRGFVLIINIEKFSRSCGLRNRDGSQKDVDALCEVFTSFGYSIIVEKNLTHDQILQTVKLYAERPEHGRVDAGGLVIMTHGLMHHLFGSDGQLVKLDDIVNFFTNKSCPLLARKPKFIILQACRGDERDRGVLVPEGAQVMSKPDDHIDGPANQSDPSSWIALPYMSDCVIAYSTLPGFVSWRSETGGSWYVQVFVEVLKDLGSQLHFIDLLCEVNRRMVEEGATAGYKQISQPVTTLTRPFFLTASHK